jgi:hypothetical protein
MRNVLLSRKSAIAAGALCVLAVAGAVAPAVSADPSAVVQYSAALPAADDGDPSTGADAASGAAQPAVPSVSREVFARVPRRDVYALTQFAISPELGGLTGIAGVTTRPYEGRGESYPDTGVNLADALGGSLGEAGVVALIAAFAAMLAVAIAAPRPRPDRN